MAGTLTIDILKASSGVLATQNGMTGICKAWVNWNGTDGSVRTSFNISSVTRTATGKYTITFATAMPSASYCVVGGNSSQTGAAINIANTFNTGDTVTEAPTASSFKMYYAQTSTADRDPLYAHVAVFTS